MKAWRQYKQMLAQIEQAKEMRADPDLADIAEEELRELLPREEAERIRKEILHVTPEKLEKEADAGKIFLMQPSVPIQVGRTEGDPQKLQETYDLGRFDAEQRIEEMKRFLAGAKETL